MDLIAKASGSPSSASPPGPRSSVSPVLWMQLTKAALAPQMVDWAALETVLLSLAVVAHLGLDSDRGAPTNTSWAMSVSSVDDHDRHWQVALLTPLDLHQVVLVLAP